MAWRIPDWKTGLLNRDTLRPISTNTDAAVASAHLEFSSDFRWDTDPSHSASALLEQAPPIEPGRSYLLEFDFAQPDATKGVLQIKGSHFLREYGLPEHGGPKSLERAGTMRRSCPSGPRRVPKPLTVTFFPADAVPAGTPGASRRAGPVPHL